LSFLKIKWLANSACREQRFSLIESGQRKVEALELQKLARLYQRHLGYFTGRESADVELPHQVAHLARPAAKLSNRDRD
jgi:hypothetical protein